MMLGEDGCGGLGMLTALVTMEALLFGLFTFCMLCDQVGQSRREDGIFGLID